MKTSTKIIIVIAGLIALKIFGVLLVNNWYETNCFEVDGAEFCYSDDYENHMISTYPQSFPQSRPHNYYTHTNN